MDVDADTESDDDDNDDDPNPKRLQTETLIDADQRGVHSGGLTLDQETAAVDCAASLLKALAAVPCVVQEVLAASQGDGGLRHIQDPGCISVGVSGNDSFVPVHPISRTSV